MANTIRHTSRSILVAAVLACATLIALAAPADATPSADDALLTTGQHAIANTATQATDTDQRRRLMPQDHDERTQVATAKTDISAPRRDAPAR